MSKAIGSEFSILSPRIISGRKCRYNEEGKRGENGNTSLPIQIFNQAAISSVSHLVHASGDDTQIDLEQEMITHDGIT